MADLKFSLGIQQWCNHTILPAVTLLAGYKANKLATSYAHNIMQEAITNSHTDFLGLAIEASVIGAYTFTGMTASAVFLYYMGSQYYQTKLLKRHNSLLKQLPPHKHFKKFEKSEQKQ